MSVASGGIYRDASRPRLWPLATSTSVNNCYILIDFYRLISEIDIHRWLISIIVDYYRLTTSGLPRISHAFSRTIGRFQTFVLRFKANNTDGECLECSSCFNDVVTWNTIFCLLKIKQLRFVYLEGFIFYVPQRLEGSPKQMQLSLFFAIGFGFWLISDFQISG